MTNSKIYIDKYKSPNNFSDILLYSDGEYLTGLVFEKSKDDKINKNIIQKSNLEIFEDTKRWLDIYFSGKIPDFIPKYKINNLTSFRKEVIDIMKDIEYGSTITYGDIAKQIAKSKGINKMSSQAVGSAVGFNPICIIIPCHRVVGINNKLTGYGGGIENKIALLSHEGINIKEYK